MNQKKLTTKQEIARLNKVVSQLYLANINIQKSLENMAKILKDNNINHVEQ